MSLQDKIKTLARLEGVDESKLIFSQEELGHFFECPNQYPDTIEEITERYPIGYNKKIKRKLKTYFLGSQKKRRE